MSEATGSIVKKGIETGTAKVGMKVRTVDGDGKIIEILNNDTVVVKLDSGNLFKGDLEFIEELKK